MRSQQLVKITGTFMKNGLISVVIITLNEERNIARCLESVKDIADEVIVLDGFSTDKTPDICAEYQVQFIQRAWEGYAPTKNYLNSLARFPYILSLDADEALSPELKASILTSCNAGLKGIYRIRRRTNYCGKWIYHSGWYPDIKSRLFPAGDCRWEGAYVHEELVYKGRPQTTLLDGDLYHYSYYSYDEHLSRANEYALLSARKYAEKGKKADPLKPCYSAAIRFFTMYILKAGFLDGKAGFKIAQISAVSNYTKYRELRRLNARKRREQTH